MKEDKNILLLFVAGKSSTSMRSIINIKAFCEKYLKDKYKLDIIDIYEQPLKATAENIIAVPVLIKKFPFPEEKMIGDLSDSEMMLNEFYFLK